MLKTVLGVLLISFSICAQTNPTATKEAPVAAAHTTQNAERKRSDFYTRATAFMHDVRQLEPLDRHQRSEGEMERDDIREHARMPALLVCKAGATPDSHLECELNWGSDTLHSHYIMEQLRADIVWLRTIRGDALVDDGKKIWEEARDIFCQEQPKAVYTDPDGVSRTCGKN
jgi:hypothetical protein